MNKTELKKLFLEGIAGIVVVIFPLVILFTLPQLVLACWLSGLSTLILMKRRNPTVITSKKYQLFEKLLYLQIINWSFAFFFEPVFSLIVFLIPITMLVLAIDKNRRVSRKFLKWATYIGFHLFNWLLLLILIGFFPEIGGIEGISVLPVITFINGGYGAIYLSLEHRLTRGRKIIALMIVLAMMIMMTVSRFPQDGHVSLFERMFGG
ncbi:MAG: hypothetical protein FWG67_02405 [Defluviitaleaceae bacterium]|nr:hypothetical protein [Defluviitaleaceae bacterium]